MKNYSAIRENKTMPFTATQMQPYIVTLNKTERQTPCAVTYMWNLEYGADELICETERLTDRENKLLVAKGKAGWEGWLGVWGKYMQTITRMDKKQGPTILHSAWLCCVRLFGTLYL